MRMEMREGDGPRFIPYRRSVFLKQMNKAKNVFDLAIGLRFDSLIDSRAAKHSSLGSEKHFSQVEKCRRVTRQIPASQTPRSAANGLRLQRRDRGGRRGRTVTKCSTISKTRRNAVLVPPISSKRNPEKHTRARAQTEGVEPAAAAAAPPA